MKIITTLNAGIKIFFTITIFIFIKDQNDLPLVALLNSVGYLIVGVLSLIIITKILV